MKSGSDLCNLGVTGRNVGVTGRNPGLTPRNLGVSCMCLPLKNQPISLSIVFLGVVCEIWE